MMAANSLRKRSKIATQVIQNFHGSVLRFSSFSHRFPFEERSNLNFEEHTLVLQVVNHSYLSLSRESEAKV
jgi:hypothetical protein